MSTPTKPDAGSPEGTERTRDADAPKPVSDQVELEVELLRPPEGAPGASPASPEPAVRPFTVLVVDDDADMRRYMRRSLVRWGERDTRVVEAASGREALALIEDVTADLVIVDVVLPGMDGFELIRALRRARPDSIFPILLVTGELPWRDANNRAREAGAQAVLGKPFNARKLCDVVKRLVGSRAPPDPTRVSSDPATQTLREEPSP